MNLEPTNPETMNLEPTSPEPTNLEPTNPKQTGPEPMNLEPMNLGCQEKKLNTELKRLHLEVASEGNPTVQRGELGLFGFGDTLCSFPFSEVTVALHSQCFWRSPMLMSRALIGSC